jgi:GNAT superfamily N-acetyltransferase
MTEIAIFEFRRPPWLVSTDPARLDLGRVHHWLSTASYWAEGIPFDVVERGFRHSCAFGVYAEDDSLAGFARVVTDYASFGYASDVFILPDRRGHGLGKLLVEAMLAHPELQGLRRWLLMTRDAHGLYGQYGFTPLGNPLRAMERHDPGVYGPKR